MARGGAGGGKGWRRRGRGVRWVAGWGGGAADLEGAKGAGGGGWRPGGRVGMPMGGCEAPLGPCRVL